MQDKLKGLAQRLDGLATRFQLHGQFAAADDVPAAPHTALLSYAAWQHRYGGKRDVLGQVVTLNGESTVIIGVLPREFHFAPVGQAEFWVAYQASSECDLRRSCHDLADANPASRRSVRNGFAIHWRAE